MLNGACALLKCSSDRHLERCPPHRDVSIGDQMFARDLTSPGGGTPIQAGSVRRGIDGVYDVDAPGRQVCNGVGLGP